VTRHGGPAACQSGLGARPVGPIRSTGPAESALQQEMTVKHTFGTFHDRPSDAELSESRQIGWVLIADRGTSSAALV
jgi:hypothetical protein